MSEKEQNRAFEDDLCRLIDRYAQEFPEVTVGGIVMALEKEKFRLLAQLHRLEQRPEDS